MADVSAVLDDLRTAGAQLWVHEGRLRFRPHEALTAERVEVLKAHRAEAIALLAAQRTAAGPAPMVTGPRPEPPPLSHTQESMWFLDELKMLGPAYNVRTVLRVHGEVDIAALRSALDEVVRRHEILRTRFDSVDGAGVQIVMPAEKARFDLVDLTVFDAQARQGKADELVRAHARTEFDLRGECSFVVQLLRLAPAEHLMVINVHHILFDGSSLDILLGELSTLYAAYRRGEPSPLPDLPAQYADYAVWQRERLRDRTAGQLDYWRERLADAPDSLDLPLDHPRPPIADYAGEVVNVHVPPEVSAALAKLGQANGATSFMVMLTAFQALLSRWSGQHDISVGIPVDTRGHRDAEKLIGCFLNTVVVRTDLADRSTFTELVQQVRTRLMQAYDHRDVPFDRLVAELRPDRSIGRQPLFQVMFSYLMEARPALADLDLSFVEYDDGTAKFDLSLFVGDTPRGFECGFEYATSLFDRATVERLAEYFLRLLEGIAAEPDIPVAEQPLLSDPELRQVLTGWNAATTPIPDRCVHELFEQQVARTPDATAVVFGEQSLTYRQLDARANQVAHRLCATGIGVDNLVAIHAERSIELMVAVYGVLKTGAAYLPLDPSLPPGRLEYILANSNADAILVQGAAFPGTPPVPVFSVDDPQAWADWPTTKPGSVALPDARAYVIYTSGSTGRPKGVVNTHRGLVNQLDWLQRDHRLDASDTVVQKTPFGFDVSVMELFWPLTVGARLVLAAPEGHRDPQYLRDLINREQVTTVHFVPSMLGAFLADEGLPACRTVRRVLCSGEELPRTVVDRFFTQFDCQLHNLYGPTEAAIHCSGRSCAPGETGPVPIGRPTQNSPWYVLDEDLAPVPIGVPGQLHIAGVQLAQCYLGRPDLTAEQFVPDPFGPPGGRLYQTGDLARLGPDGTVTYLGRLDFQVKIRGYRIELGEIERTLAQVPGVRDAVVVAAPDTTGGRLLIAYVAGDRARVEDEARTWLSTALPEYMLPVAYVFLDSLPLNANGKVDRRALPEPQLSGAEFVAPSTAVEIEIAEIWQDVLRVDGVGVHDNFFALGGHSLLASQVVARIRKNLADVPLRDFLTRPTVAGLAALVEPAGELARTQRRSGVL